MTLIRWSDNYLIHEMLIDDQHRYLFKLINDFYDGFMQKQSRQEILILLNRLIDYAQRHFADEERIMAEHRYPRLDEHRELHGKLIDQVFALNEKFADRALNPQRDTIAFLEHWLTGHILAHDVPFAAHLAASDGGGTKKA